jgi:hypothetical protein
VIQKGKHSTQKSKIRRFLKEKIGKQIMHGRHIRSMDSVLAIIAAIAVEGRAERRN